MAVENPDHERERLTRVYAGMSEGELQKIAGVAPDLTEVARQALADEIERRGLNIRLADYIAADVLEFQEQVTIRRSLDLREALLAKGMLDSAGIDSSLVDDNLVRVHWGLSNILGGIKLQVKPEDADAASEVLKQPTLQRFEVEGAASYQQPRCPSCQSLDVTLQSVGRSEVYVSARLGVPLPAEDFWKCESCGHRWPLSGNPND